MTTVTFHRTDTGEIKGFDCIGHSGYAKSGSDIVCAAVSTLVINTINAIEEVAHDSADIVSNEEEGLISCMFPGKPNRDSEVLLKALELGISGIAEQYDNYCRIKNQEV